jgi:ribosomal protein S18 acetylase RimI-like enzyme
MGTQTEILEVEPTGDLVRSVITLGNGPAKRTLGFLPDQGFLDRARKGTLLAAVVDDQLLGYVLYDLPGHDVKIVHLCVSPDARQKGIARRLIEEVAKRHAGRHRIVLSCRYDYEATAVWEALGFRPQGSRPGRSQAGHMLTVWVRDFEPLTLFDDFHDERAVAALDHNVFLDLHMDETQRPQGEESRYLLADWIGEYVEFCLTDEVFYEIHKHVDADERAVEQQWASSYRNVSKPNDGWADLVDEIATLAPKTGTADHRHVARAAAAGATYLVSRDGDLLDAARAIEEALGLVVLPPEGLIVRLDRMRSDDPYQPVALQGTELSQLSPSADMHEELLRALLNHGVGEKRAELGSRLRPMLADREHHEVQVVQAADGRIVAGFARQVVDRRLEIPFIRVVPGAAGANVIARQLVFGQRKRAADSQLLEVRITDSHISRDIRAALKPERFEERAGIWTCQVETGIVEAQDVGVDDGLSSTTAVDFEDKFWPVKVSGAEISTYLVPIKVAFAEALFDLGLAEQSLLPRQLGLGLSREHVYYRSTQNARGIAAGARILWYVTGDAPIHSRGSVRAVSQVSDVVIGRPRSLHARFERFGVYSEEQVSSRADGSGNVMALRFANTEVLQHPISLDALTSIWGESGERFFPPLSPMLISERMFCLLYERSSAYAG